MKLHTFHIPVLAPEAAQDALNRHLASHRVAHVDRQFVADGAASFWAVCVTSIDGSEGTGAASTDAARKARSVDWREKLSVDEFALYDRLRSARKTQAESEGLPPYAVFSNEQLAAMVLGRVTTAAALAGRLPDGRLLSFTIRDPKLRTIHAAPFADRVAHHAIVRLMEPRLERALVPTSFACRPGRGVHAAIAHARVLMRAHPSGWSLQLDALHCLPSIGHAALLALLARRFKGGVLGLLQQLLAGYASAPGRGLPGSCALHGRHRAVVRRPRPGTGPAGGAAGGRGGAGPAVQAGAAAAGGARFDLVRLPAGLAGPALRPAAPACLARRLADGALALAAGAGRRCVPPAALQHTARTGAAGRSGGLAAALAGRAGCGAAARGRCGAGGPVITCGANASTPPPSGCCRAARGSTTRATAGRRSATPTIRPTATTTSASGWPERFPAACRKPTAGTCPPWGLVPCGGKPPVPRRASRHTPWWAGIPPGHKPHTVRYFRYGAWR